MTDAIQEPSRPIPVLGSYDVVVCGGGPAGCASAIGAARHGARTLLIEKDGYLGGATVSQLVAVILSTNGADFQGIWHEYLRGLRKRNGVRPFTGSAEKGQIRSCVDPEQVKYVWDELVTAAGARILHHGYSATCMLEDGRAAGVFVQTRAGRQAIRAKRVIDCTGDGIVAAESGVAYESGDGTNPWAMSCTKMLRLGNVPSEENWPGPEALEQAAAALDAAVERGEYDAPVVTEKNRLMNYLRGKLWLLPENRRELGVVLSRVLKVDPLDPFDFTRAEREGREQARQTADFICRYVPGFEESYFLDTSNQIGLRSSRRLKGVATVTDEDARSFAKYEDSIARSSWNIDIWPADSYTAPAVDRKSEEFKTRNKLLVQGEYFDIRYGCLVAEGIDNLLMAGRCLSAEHQAESSLRIQQTCMATGQAAGVAAALSLDADTTPRELDPMTVVAQLDKDRDVEQAFETVDCACPRNPCPDRCRVERERNNRRKS